MTAPSRWREIEHLLTAALALAPEQRDAFLRQACAKDSELHREVLALLSAHEGSGPLDDLARGLFPPRVQPSAASPTFAGRKVGPYEVSERLGGGGMGVVYAARDARLDRPVALKFLSPELSADPSAKQRFMVEARAAGALDHVNICTIYEVGETDDGQPFIAMPCYPGETLKERLNRGALRIDEALTIAVQIARAVASAHERGIVHRDVKPANVLITPEEVVKLLDFGVARRHDSSLTGQGVVPGTVAYMSPEQARGDVVDARTDLWSIGVVLYEMLAGGRPFSGSHDQVILRSILNADPAPLPSLRADVPPALTRIVDKALAKRPQDRHQTARDLERELDGLSGNAIEPAPERRAGATASPRGVAHAARPGESSVAEPPTGILPQGDRRQATIIVSNLSGYAGLIEALVPEEVEQVVETIRREATGVAARHEGMLNRFRGDEIVLVFGIPATHEDDCRRAVRAALELHERIHGLSADIERRVGLSIHAHTGIDTSQIVVRRADVSDTEYRIAGSASNVAAQLSARSGTDEVWVSAECQRLIGPFFEMVAGSPMSVRDRGEQLIPYRVIRESGLQTRLEAAEKAGLTAYTGRDAELAILRESLDDAIRGQGRFVTVVGEAGMGKSRLLHELYHWLDHESVLVLRGRCQSYGGGIAYLPFIEVLRNCLHLEGARDSSRLREQTIAQVRQIAPELDEFLPLYLHLLSLPGSPGPAPKHLFGEQFRQMMQEAIAAILTLSATRRPTVLLLEDWHWVDEASDGALEHVVEMVSDYPLLVVATCRPGPSLKWGTSGPHTSVALRPLEVRSSIAMLESILRARSLPDELGSLLHARTGGNPFFLEEICQTLIEDGTIRVENGRAVLSGSLASLELPETVQAVIRTRLDRLNRDAREVVRLASVIGREFTRSILERTFDGAGRLPGALQAVKAAGLIQQTHVIPDAAYRFKHVLTQEVAYASLLEHQRKDLHGRVGAAIEELYHGRVEDHLERLAHHFSRAEEWGKAVRYGLRSAERDAALSQFAEALQILERAQVWVGRLPAGPFRDDSRTEILLRQERLCETLGLRGRQQRIIDELIALLEPGDDRDRLAEVYLRRGDVHTLLRQFDAAEEALTRSLQLRRDLGDAVGERNTLRSFGLLRWHQGRSGDAIQYVEQALAIDRLRDDTEAIVGDLSNMGPVLKAMGEYDRARAHLEEALSISEQAMGLATDAGSTNELSFRQAYILQNLANIHRELGDDGRALDYLHRAKELTASKRFPIQLSYHLTTIAHMNLQMGKVEESLQYYHDAVDLTRKAKYAPGLAQSLRFLGEVLLGLDRHDESLPHLEEAATLFSQLKDRETEALMWGKVASIHERAAHFAESMAAWSKARTLRQQTGNLAGELEALEGIARVTRRYIAEPSVALGYYRDALELAEALHDRAAESRLRNALGISEWSRGEYEEALLQFERARELFAALGDHAGVGLMLNSIGATFRDLGRPEEARFRLEEALDLYRTADQPRLEGDALAVLGDVRVALGEFERATECYQRSLGIRRGIGDRAGEGWMLHHLARTHFLRGFADPGRQLAAEATQIGREIGDQELMDTCERLRHMPSL